MCVFCLFCFLNWFSRLSSAEFTGVGRKVEKAVQLCLSCDSLRLISLLFSFCLICSKPWHSWRTVAKSLDDSRGGGSLPTSILEAELASALKAVLFYRVTSFKKL